MASRRSGSRLAILAGIAALVALAVPETRPAEDPESRAPGAGCCTPQASCRGLILMTGVWGMGGYFTLLPPYAVGPLGLDGAGCSCSPSAAR